MKEIEKIIGYNFKNTNLLRQAMTHSSRSHSSNENYERLEFLGDRVLGVFIAKMLYEAFPDNPEGALSQRFMGLVCKETVAFVALKLGLDKYIKIGVEEIRRNDNVLCDTCEAVIGAIFVDGGYEEAFKFVEKNWGELLLKNKRPPKDAKTTLQEVAHVKSLGVPVYKIESRSGTEHDPIYSISVSFETVPSEVGSGKSKKLAEQAAALKMLKVLGVECGE